MTCSKKRQQQQQIIEDEYKLSLLYRCCVQIIYINSNTITISTFFGIYSGPIHSITINVHIDVCAWQCDHHHHNQPLKLTVIFSE